MYTMDHPTMSAGLLSVFVVVMVVFGILSLALAIPLTGAAIRVRANYVPKEQQIRLEGDPEVDIPVPEAVTNVGFFKMLARVWRIEGWAGLYKGIWPTFLATIVTGIVSGRAAFQPINPGLELPKIGLLHLAQSLFILFISIPFIVLLDRTVVTPYRLPTKKWRRNLKILLNPKERKFFLSIYATPGLVAAVLLNALLNYVLVIPLAGFQIVSPAFSFKNTKDIIALVGYSAIVFIVSLLSTPLEVIIAKLAVQPNIPEDASVEEIPDVVRYSEHSDVVQFREDQPPYEGLVDCARKIVQEEGWRALFRLWWINLLGGAAVIGSLLLIAFAPKH